MSAHDVSDHFERLVEQHYERIFRVIYRLVGDYHEAEDLTQDTFVNAYRARNGFRGDSQVYTWLYRIAVNLTRNRLEHLNRRAAAGGGAEAREDWWSDEGREVRPDREAENTELGQVVAQAVLRLRPDYREVVVLREYELLSYEDIARILGCSVPTVKTRLFRARSVLRRKLARYLEE